MPDQMIVFEQFHHVSKSLNQHPKIYLSYQSELAMENKKFLLLFYKRPLDSLYLSQFGCLVADKFLNSLKVLII